MKMYYSLLCPDCTKALAKMVNAGVKCEEMVNVTNSMKELREFIYFREEHTENWEPLRPNRSIGVPCFVLDDGTISFDVEDVLQ